MSLEKTLGDLRAEIIILNENITELGKLMQGSPYDDLPSDVEPPDPKPKVTPKPKPKAQKTPKPEPKTEAPDDAGVVTLLDVQKAVTELSKKDRAKAVVTVGEFVPAGQTVKLGNVPEKDYAALIAAVEEALEELAEVPF